MSSTVMLYRDFIEGMISLLDQYDKDRVEDRDLLQDVITLSWKDTKEGYDYWNRYWTDTYMLKCFNMKNILGLFWQVSREFISPADHELLQLMVKGDPFDRHIAVSIIRVQYNNYSGPNPEIKPFQTYSHEEH